jgi:hypothetical protein
MTTANTISNYDHEYTAEQAERFRSNVRDHIKTHTDASIQLASALFYARYGTLKGSSKTLVEAWGFPDFETYAEKELLIHGGTAKAYVRVYDELCVRRKFDEGVLPPSFTALRELSKVSRKLTDQRELHRWIKKAHELTACEFKDEVEKEIYGRAGKRRSLGFSMPWGAANRCMKRIREAREAYGFKTNGEALERILTDHSVGKRTASEIRALKRAG